MVASALVEEVQCRRDLKNCLGRGLVEDVEVDSVIDAVVVGLEVDGTKIKDVEAEGAVAAIGLGLIDAEVDSTEVASVLVEGAKVECAKVSEVLIGSLLEGSEQLAEEGVEAAFIGANSSPTEGIDSGGKNNNQNNNISALHYVV